MIAFIMIKLFICIPNFPVNVMRTAGYVIFTFLSTVPSTRPDTHYMLNKCQKIIDHLKEIYIFKCQGEKLMLNIIFITCLHITNVTHVF